MTEDELDEEVAIALSFVVLSLLLGSYLAYPINCDAPRA